MFKWFIFNRTRYMSPRFEVEIRHEGRDNQTIQITDATYNRFVALANSGEYNIEIRPASEGLSWELTHHSQPKPAASHDGIRDGSTLAFAPAHQCPVEADGNILFA
jgi:hypothetical protein